VNETDWTLYLLRTERGTLYTGITTDLARRLRQHRGELTGGARFTRGCREVTLVYHCVVGGHREALRAEARVRRLRKPDKERLIAARPERAALLLQLGLPTGG